MVYLNIIITILIFAILSCVLSTAIYLPGVFKENLVAISNSVEVKDVYQVVNSKKDKNFKKHFRKVAVLFLAGMMLYAPIVEHKEDIKYIFDSQSYVGDYNYLTSAALQKVCYNASSAIVPKGISLAKDDGLLAQGYFMVCTAIELYDGSYILQSRPIILSPPYITKKDVYKFIGKQKLKNVFLLSVDNNKKACIIL